jgi:selenocysteine lyase/cysteine desulfurase
MPDLETYFDPFRSLIIGNDACYESPYGNKRIRYFDWVAGGRLYKPIEDKLTNTFGPFVANTHTENSETGWRMTECYKYAHEYIKRQVNAGPDDVIITAGTGMTSVVNKLQRILGLKTGNQHMQHLDGDAQERPVVFITHMEHHSNQTSWYETQADVVIIPPDDSLMISLDALRTVLKQYAGRRYKIGAFTACSNVTGIMTPYHEMAAIMHENQGLCFVDFAASAPYVSINMHPADPLQKLDAIYFSPHKFLGGPGSSGVLLFNRSIYHADVPDDPGGGTVDWTNPWGEYKYTEDIEVREDGGTPGFLQTFKAALAMELKEAMGVKQILQREEELVKLTMNGLKEIPGINILANNSPHRLGIISFFHPDIHFNLIVRLLSDRYGIQARGGCACAGTYGHFLLEVSYTRSHEITEKISQGDLSEKPGWVRISLHPVMKNDDVIFFINAIKEIVANSAEWKKEYIYNPKKNEFQHRSRIVAADWINEWFKL